MTACLHPDTTADADAHTDSAVPPLPVALAVHLNGRALRIGTRTNSTALRHATRVANTIGRTVPGLPIELTRIATGPTQISAVSATRFAHDLDTALVRGEIDIAVHNLVAMPGDIDFSPGTHLAGVLGRTDVDDVVLHRYPHRHLANLGTGATVGASCARLAAQLSAWRRDLHVHITGGDLGSRIDALDNGEYEALVCASTEVGPVFRHRITQHITAVGTATADQPMMIPAPGHGAIGMQANTAHHPILRLAEQAADPDATTAITAERAFLQTLRVPHTGMAHVAAHANIDEDNLTLTAAVYADTDTGWTVKTGQHQGPVTLAADIGRHVAEDLLFQGAGALYDESGTH